LIQIQIPLTTFRHDFTVYEVIKFPVPVTGHPTYNTFLLNLPRYFVTSRHNNFYFTLENDDIKRNPKLLYLTDSRISFNSFNTGATCLSALFRNYIMQVREICSFQLQEVPPELQIHFLSNSRILLTNVSEMAIKCGTKDSIFQGCTQCIRDLACNCQVTILAPNSSVPSRSCPPKISTCRYDVNVRQIQHIINLAALQSFFTDDSLGSLSASTYLNQPLPVHLPQLNQFKHQYHQFLSKDIQSSHNLHKFSNRVKNDSINFQGVSDVILHDMQNIISSNDDDSLLSPRVTHVTWWLQWTSILFHIFRFWQFCDFSISCELWQLPLFS